MSPRSSRASRTRSHRASGGRAVDRSNPKRRHVLAGAAGITALAGCFGLGNGSEDPIDDETATDTELDLDVAIDSPYEGLDWDAVENHKSQFHNHPEKWEEPHRMVDLYHGSGEDDNGNTLAEGDGYTVYAVADMGIRPILWPWTELSRIEGEDRDPEELDVVAFPGAEIRSGIEHFNSLFSVATDQDHDADTQLEAIKAVLDSPTDTPKNLVTVNHPERYYNDPDDAWEKYVDHFEELSLDDGLLGFEILNRDSTNRGFGRDEGMLDLDLWDHLLGEFMPDRNIWGYGVDDAGEFVIGEEVDIRWTEILLEDEEFDPSNQEDSRQAAMEAMLEGRVFGVEREPWDHDSEDPPATPSIDEVAVEGATVSIEASDYDVIDWISNGEVVDEGDSHDVTPDDVPYVRAEVWNTSDAKSVAITQPIGVTESE